MEPTDDQSPLDRNQEYTNGEDQLPVEPPRAATDAGEQQPRSVSDYPTGPGGPTSGYRGMSEQVHFQYPQQEQAEPFERGSYPPLTPPSAGPAWNYPPRPEVYQAQVPGQQWTGTNQPSRPLALPGQFGQSTPLPAGTYGSTYEAPPGYGSLHHARNQTSVQRDQSMASAVAPQDRRTGSGLRTGAIIALVVVVILVFGTGIVSGWDLARNGNVSGSSALQPGKASTVTIPTLNGNNEEAVREAVINKVQPGIVEINVTTSSGGGLGSGVIVDGRGYIVTNDHVVTGTNSIEVTLSDGTNLPAQVVGTDTADDLAVVKITPPAGGLTTVPLGDSSKLVVGQTVMAIGSPLGDANTVTSGIISALNRNVSEGQNQPTLPDAIQTDAPINPGNSGGALVDLQGNLVGIPTLSAIDTEFNTPAQGLGFAIPANRINNAVQQIINNGQVLHTGRAVMGVEVSDIDQSVVAQYNLNVTSGALIVNVTTSGAAAAAGLQARDVIVQINGTTINDVADVSTVLLQEKPGQAVAVKVYRGTQQKTFNVTLGELPAN